MKKILIISGNNHLCISGVDNYSKRIIDILSKEDCLIDEYSFEINMSKDDFLKKDNIRIISPNKIHNDCKKLKLKWWIKNTYNVLFSSNRELNKLIDEYDLVIDSTLMLVRSKKVINSKKYLYIQHQGVDFFEMKRYGIFRYFAIFLVWIFRFKNPFKVAKNIIFYDEKNKQYIENKFPKKANVNYFTIINSRLTREEITQNKIVKDNFYKNNDFKYNIIYIGRITIEQKRMNDLNQVLKLTKNKLNVWGFGTYIKNLTKNKNISYHGKLENNEVVNILLQSKWSILISDYEGLSTSMVESICSLTPIIIRDSHFAASFLVDNGKNGVLLDNHYNKLEYAKAFDDLSNISIKELQEMSNNCYKFAIQNLLYETFVEKWLEVYTKLTDLSNE